MLLLYLRTGDEKAFREIYQRYWKKLYFTAVRKIEEANIVEELIQDIFLKLWERRTELQVERLDAYLFSSVRYAVINHIKANLVQEKYADYAQHHYSDACSVTEEQLELDELIQVVEQQLNDLPEKTRKIFQMNRLEYHTVKEISSKLKVPERTVEYHLSQALKSLRHYLRDYLPTLLSLSLFL
ncbi:MAG: RNA polymerase sigma-70 factor [Bacteroidetes bacterium]|nr:RNA polymerase sigma-70 factor [Bacteroidota bacterium]